MTDWAKNYSNDPANWGGFIPADQGNNVQFGMDMSEYGNSKFTPNGLDTGKNFGALSNIGKGVAAFGTLAQLYLGFKAMGAQKKAFNFQKAAWQKGFDASLKDYDNQLKSEWEKKKAGNSFFGNQDYQSLDSYLADRSLSPATQASAQQSSAIAPPTQATTPRNQPSTGYGNFDRKQFSFGY